MNLDTGDSTVAGTIEENYAINETVKSKPVNLVICQEEQPDNFIQLLEDKLNEQYINTTIIGIYNDEELDEKIELLKKQNPRFVPIHTEKNWDWKQTISVIKESLNDKDTYWVQGNRKILDKIHYPKLVSIRKNEHVFDYLDNEVDESAGLQELPETIAIFFTTKCNYTCFFCRHTNVGEGALPIDKFYAFKNLIQKAKILNLTGWGEPFTYKYIKDVLNFINKNNSRECIQLNSNGSLLTEELAQLLSRNLNALTISINAARKSTYERDMTNGKWEKVIYNLKNARKYIPKDKWTLSFVGHRDNIEEFPELVELAAELDFGTVELKHLIVTFPENIIKSLWFHKEKTNEVFDRALELGKKFNIKIVGKKFSDPQTSEKVTTCEAPYTWSLICVNGDVVPCCYADDHTMGNIYVSDSFEDIWNNKKYRRLRKDRFLDVCQTCGANSDLNKLENHIEPHLFLEMHKQLPKISVIIPINRIFNNFSKVMLALLDQTYPVWEAIIVCNDESENSIRNLLDCKDNRIRIIKSKNKEFYSSLNDGLKNASGKYFCYMTLSNLFRPDKLETQYKEFEKLDNNYALIYLSNLKRNVDPNSLNSEAIDMDSVIIRMEAIKRLGGFNLSACDPGEDLIIRLKDQGYLTKSIQTEWTTNLAKYFVSKAENNLLQDNDPGKAILTFKMAIEEDPFLIEAFNNIGVIYAYYHKYDEALEYLNKALELDPGYRKAIISIGEINRVLGKLDKAHSLYAGYLEENSNDLEIKELLECLN